MERTGKHEQCRQDKEYGTQQLLSAQTLDYHVIALIAVRELACHEKNGTDGKQQ